MTAPAFASVDEFRAHAAASVRALNAAVDGIPTESMRIHVCWGGGEFPRTTDIPLADILDILLDATPAGLMIMGANGRHAHERRVFEKTPLPDGKYLVPGVIDVASNVVEHPEVVAERIERYASVVGPDRVVAGTDCGFSNIAGLEPVAPTVVRAKLRTLAEGAAIAGARMPR